MSNISSKRTRAPVDKLYVDFKQQEDNFHNTTMDEESTNNEFQHHPIDDKQSSVNLSPFSTSPDDSDDLQNSCEDLRNAFSQATIHTHLIQPFLPGEGGRQQYQQPNYFPYQAVKEQDEEELPLAATTAITNTINTTTIDNDSVSLISMVQHFPDLPAFICHDEFPVFSEIWVEFQRNTLLARDPIHRPQVQSWLQSAALQIHYTMVTIVKTTTADTPIDVESQPRRMFSAFRRLKDRIEIMFQVFEIIEKGRVLFGQSPSAAIAPLIDAAIKIKKDVSYFSSKYSQVIPVMDSNTINLKRPQEVTMTELSNRVMDTYNLMPYNKSTTTAANNLIVCSAAATMENSSLLPSAAANSGVAGYFDTPIVGSTNTTSIQPVVAYQDNGASSSTPAAIYIQNQQHSHQNFIVPPSTTATQNEPFHQPITVTTNEPRVPLYSHIQPSWMHYASSVPVTPSAVAEHKHQQQYLSLPTSPTCTSSAGQEAYSPTATAVDNHYYNTPRNTESRMSPTMTVYHSQQEEDDTPNHSPLNTISEDSSDYDHQEQKEVGDEDMEIDIEDIDKEEEEDMEDDDEDEYVISDDGQDEDYKEEKSSRPSTRRGSRSTTVSRSNLNNNSGQRRVTQQQQTQTQQQRQQQLRIERHYTRRTATSYDAQTTHYLKSIFFDIYSSRDKLTKDQRRQVQKQTGLKPRNITYWFSNHKRRFQNSLLVFKKIVKESKGAVKTYDDFLNWRKERGLPEEVLENEYLEMDQQEAGGV